MIGSESFKLKPSSNHLVPNTNYLLPTEAWLELVIKEFSREGMLFSNAFFKGCKFVLANNLSTPGLVKTGLGKSMKVSESLENVDFQRLEDIFRTLLEWEKESEYDTEEKHESDNNK